MAGLALTTDLGLDSAMSTATKAASDLGFEVPKLTERQFRAKRGSLTLSWLLPPVTPYCNFLVTVRETEEGCVEIVLERNTPWWTGYFGVRGVEQQFDKLAAATEVAVGNMGGRVLSWRHF
ncbi:MAG TPA: hypothetical protein VE988_22195 [Gemmataceae bacterium]|nr:hypothetical protein [Gemmataceae bacterium]